MAFGAMGTCGAAQAAVKPPNLLVLVADDLGCDKVGFYDALECWSARGIDVPPTPVIDGLAAGGVVFTNAYTSPVCSPSRANVLVGKYGFDRDVLLGQGIKARSREPALPLAEETLAEVLKQATHNAFQTFAVGKWHLGSRAVGGPRNPKLQGFDQFRGCLGNLPRKPGKGGYAYASYVNGKKCQREGYVTSLPGGRRAGPDPVRGPEPPLVPVARVRPPARPGSRRPRGSRLRRLSSAPDELLYRRWSRPWTRRSAGSWRASRRRCCATR